MKPTKKELLSAVEFFEWLELRGALLVILGLVVEVVLAIKEPELGPLLKRWSPVIADWIVAGGVIIEVWAGRRADKGQEILKQRAERKLARVRRETAELNERAAQLEFDAGFAEERAAKAELDLQKLKQWRSLRAPEQDLIREAARPFPGTIFDTSAIRDPEAIFLMLILAEVLQSAGWVQVDWRGAGEALRSAGLPNAKSFGTLPVAGISIGCGPQEASQLMPAMTALGDAIEKAGLAVMVSAATIADTGAIHVMIGTKFVFS